jgi:UDP-N-acetylglucosamine 2-epimerase
VDTGQHYDYLLQQVHYDQLGARPPDAFLDVGSGTHAEQTGAILKACEEWIAHHRPRVAVVIGDTNSTLACALAAAKLRVPVAHVEAGLRAGDRLMAEEINRRVVDAIAELLLPPCERVAAVLRRQYPDAAVEVAGDVAYDVLRRALPLVPPLETISGYAPTWAHRYVYVTLHRAELVDIPERLGMVMDALSRCPFPCLFAAHPRTAAALERLGLAMNGRVRVTTPVGYLESLALVQGAAVVVTDSGGLQREAYWLGVPCITVRTETEWVETVERGANSLVRPDNAGLLPDLIAAVSTDRSRAGWDRTAYGNGDAAERVARAVARQL